MPDPAPLHISDGSTGLAAVGAQMRAEWRSDEEMWMRAAAQRWAHSRRVPDVVREFAARGDRVSIEVAGCTFVGAVEAVGDDRVDVATATGLVTVRTAFADAQSGVTSPVVIRRSVRSRAGGSRLPAALATFRARLLELEDPLVAVRVGMFLPVAEYVGPIVVGHDHVVVQAETETVLPACWIAYVAAASRGTT